MNRILQSPLVILLIAGAAFFGTMFVVLATSHLGSVAPAMATIKSADDDPSWRFHNPEMDQWLAQLRNERDSLTTKEQQLKEWEARLTAENRNLEAVTQSVSQACAEFDRRVIVFKEQEQVNAKKQLKMIAGMSPDSVTTLFNTLPENEAVKLLFIMKPDVSGGILDALSKLGPIGATRAATLSQKLREVLPESATNNLSSNAHN